MRKPSVCSSILLIMALALSVGALGAQTKSVLPQRHQDWLSNEVSLLITRPERAAFLALKSDQERDMFIERFWEIRNPDPGTGRNEFKEEFYRRVAWAAAHFGRDAGTEGWRSDRGRTYILFGRPQTTMSYNGNQELYPTELWFYSNPGLAELPPFFYILFFDKDGIGGYRFYHPYADGPDKLMRAGPTKAQAYHYLRGISNELARASLTFIPGEPVDTETFSGSMASGRILDGVNGYREMPSYVSLVQQRAARLERISTRIDYDVARTNLLTFVAYEQGEPWLHWQVEVRDPLQAKAAAGKVHYQVAARLFANGRMVLERTDKPSFAVSDAASADLARRPWIYEDRMPVSEGRYRLAVSIQNQANGRLYEATKEVVVERPKDRATISELLIAAKREPDTRERAFQFSGVKFSPSPQGHVSAAPGLLICYQVSAPAPRPAELSVEYIIGNVATKFRRTLEDKLDLRMADSSGTLLTAKTLSIADVPPGNYQLVVQIKDPQSGRMTARSAAVVVLAESNEIPPIVVSPVRTVSREWQAAVKYERALCLLAQDRPKDAIASLEASKSLSPNPAVEGLLMHLYESTGRSLPGPAKVNLTNKEKL